jgi:hypothetical protein
MSFRHRHSRVQFNQGIKDGEIASSSSPGSWRGWYSATFSDGSRDQRDLAICPGKPCAPSDSLRIVRTQPLGGPGCPLLHISV